jgi:D-3-phosphoglycerate dehydrogenase / 2-oxoglutarate reductase
VLDTAGNPLQVLLLEQIHPDADELLGSAGFQVRSLPRALSEDELIAEIAGVSLLGIRSKTNVTARVLEAADRLVAVGAFCIGTNQVDLLSASEHGVSVFNAPFSNTRSVVELAIAEIISMTRRLTEKNALMHDGVWDKSADGAHEIRGRSLGIVGYGNIGTQLSVLAENLGLRVYFYDSADKLALGNARRCDSLAELLTLADIVTLHVDGRQSNSNLFGAGEFAAMRPGSLFLNLSRGFVVDYSALRGHLESGHIAGAAVDVFPVEPAGRGDEFVSELRGLPNVILTPHIGGSTEEAQESIGREVATSLARFLESGSTIGAVNFPNVELPQQRATHRILNVHKNVPGVLRDINKIVSDRNANIHAQVLATDASIGYLIMDLDHDVSSYVCCDVAALSTNIATRMVR